jgi:hypothetical protein
MKYIIDACVADYDNKIGTWLCFINTVQNFKNVEYLFTAALHDARLKRVFNSDFLVDDYGSSIKYLDFLEKYNLSII